jgi:hypothetical protein
MSMLSPAGAALVRLMGEMPRGPRREGLFALWLTLRVAEDALLIPPPPERGMRRRVAALAQRLSSLSFPAPLRRALASAETELLELRPERVALALQQLVAPVREVLGPEAGEAMGRAARAASLKARGEA